MLYLGEVPRCILTCPVVVDARGAGLLRQDGGQEEEEAQQPHGDDHRPPAAFSPSLNSIRDYRTAAAVTYSPLSWRRRDNLCAE